MLKKNQIWSIFITLGLLFGIAQIAVAQKSEIESESTSKFRRIEQPLQLKIGVTLGGLALIGVELWWFVFSKTKAEKARSERGIQEIDITVDGGYIPNRIVVQSGEPVRLNFFRKDSSSCLEKVLLPEFHKAADLVLKETTSIEFTPQKTGNYSFHCGMNMFRGVIEVKESANGEISQENYAPVCSVKERCQEKALLAELDRGIQEIDIKVEAGYQPKRIVVKAGLPVKLNFLRKDSNSCLEKLLLPEFDLAVNLPLNQTQSVEFTPQQPGEYRFTCGMEMFYGIVKVQESEMTGQEKENETINFHHS